MRPLICRHWWMPAAIILLSIFCVLSLVESYGWPGPTRMRSKLGYRQVHAGRSLHMVFCAMEMMDMRILYPDEDAYGQYRIRVDAREESVTNITIPQLLQEFAGKAPRTHVQDSVRRFITKNQAAWDLIRAAVKQDQFYSFRGDLQACAYTRMLLREEPRRITEVQPIPPPVGGPAPFTLNPAFSLIKSHALAAVADNDVEAFLSALETGFNIIALLFEEPVYYPVPLLHNLGEAFPLLDIVEIGLDSLSLDAAALDRIRNMIARACYHKAAVIQRAYVRQYAQFLWELDSARKAGHMPPERRRPRPGQWRSYHYEECLEYLAETWLPFGPFQRAANIHYLNRISQAGIYMMQLNEATIRFAPTRQDAAAQLLQYARNPWRLSHAEMRLTTAISDGLFETPQALWPYMDYYEPYVAMLAHARAMETAVAAARYRLDRGRLPESIEVLTPMYLAATPLDPYARFKPLDFQYHREQRRIEIRWLSDMRGRHAAVLSAHRLGRHQPRPQYTHVVLEDNSPLVEL